MDEIGRKRLPHLPPWAINPESALFFLTLCAKDRDGAPFLQNDTAPELLRAVQFYSDNHKWWVFLAVVMPDHMHLVARFPDQFVGTVRAWKHWTGRNLGVKWQRDFFDHRLRKEESLRDTVEYVLQNPVRAGLVREWKEWPHVWIAQDFIDW